MLLVVGCKGEPARQNTPPPVASRKTSAALGRADFERLSKLEVPGFDRDVRQLADNVLEVRYKTKDRPRRWAVVTIQPCLDCIPMELAKWKAKTEELKVTLAGLRDEPNVTFEVGETTLAGQPVMYTYQVGTGTTQTAGGESFGYTNNFNAYFNDGINQIKVVAAYKDDPASKEDMIKLAPKEDLERIALAFLDAFTRQW